MKQGSVDYSIQVYCRRCELKFLKDSVKLIYGYGYQCPECGGKCRTKAKYNIKARLLKHPYIKVGINRRWIVNDIKAIQGLA